MSCSSSQASAMLAGADGGYRLFALRTGEVGRADRAGQATRLRLG